MLKRNIGILIAGALLSAQVNLALADFPPTETDIIWQPLPAQARYLEERAARLQAAPVRGSAFPQTETDIIWQPLPAQAKYLEERAARLQVARVRGNTFPESETDIIWKMLPAQARYFEHREAVLQAGKPDMSAPGGD